MNDKNPQRKQNEGEAPEPERMITPDEEAGMDLAELENPPQAEGPRDPEYQEMERPDEFRERRRNEGSD